MIDLDAGVNRTIKMELTGWSALGILRVAQSADGPTFNLAVNSSALLDFEKMHGHLLTARITTTDDGGLHDTRIYNILVSAGHQRAPRGAGDPGPQGPGGQRGEHTVRRRHCRG